MKTSKKVSVIIDKSGSMGNVVTDTIGGYNAFIDELKKETPDAQVTLTLFDNNIETVYENVRANSIPKLCNHVYKIGCTTALMDAVGGELTRIIGNKEGCEHCKPTYKNIVIAVITDGYENASRKFNKSQIKDLIGKLLWLKS